MEKLTQLLDSLVKKYKMEQADIDAIDQAILDIAGVDMGDGDELNLPEMGSEDGDEEFQD